MWQICNCGCVCCQTVLRNDKVAPSSSGQGRWALIEPFCSLSIELCSMSDAFCKSKMHIRIQSLRRLSLQLLGKLKMGTQKKAFTEKQNRRTFRFDEKAHHFQTENECHGNYPLKINCGDDFRRNPVTAVRICQGLLKLNNFLGI